MKGAWHRSARQISACTTYAGIIRHGIGNMDATGRVVR